MKKLITASFLLITGAIIYQFLPSDRSQADFGDKQSSKIEVIQEMSHRHDYDKEERLREEVVAKLKSNADNSTNQRNLRKLVKNGAPELQQLHREITASNDRYYQRLRKLRTTDDSSEIDGLVAELKEMDHQILAKENLLRRRIELQMAEQFNL